MTDLSIVARASVERLQQMLAEAPQVELPTEHLFANGMYTRKLTMAEGTLAVGRIHKQEHFFMVLSGLLAVAGDGPTKLFQEGDVVVSSPGTKRVVFAVTDCVVVTVHRTDKTNLTEIEAEMIEPEELPPLFDAANILKNARLEDTK